MVEPVRTAPIDMAIASQAVGSGYTLNLGYAQKCNLVVVSGVGALTITYVDAEGNTSPAISVASGASYYTEQVTLRILQISGPASSTFAGAITWPRVVSPSDIVVSAISGKVSTSIDGQTVGVAPADTFAGSAISPSLQDQLPASLDSNGFFQTRYLGASDVPNRGWTLGSSDVPSRGWTLGSGDTPARSWTLGASDVPNRGWTLGGTDLPSRSWTLGSTDLPDVSQNQLDYINTAESFSSGVQWQTGSFTASGQDMTLTITIPAGAAFFIDNILITTPGAFNLFANMNIDSDLQSQDFLWYAAYNTYIGLAANTSLLVDLGQFKCVAANVQSNSYGGVLGGVPYITTISFNPLRWVSNSTSSDITMSYTVHTTANPGSSIEMILYYHGDKNVTFAWTFTGATSGGGGSSPPPPPPCWSEDTLIATPSGSVCFRDLRVGDTVCGWGGKPETVTEIIHNDYEETVYEIERGVWVTGDHRIKEAGVEYTPLQLLRSGKNFRTRTVGATWDCKVASGWVQTPEGRYLSDKTI